MRGLPFHIILLGAGVQALVGVAGHAAPAAGPGALVDQATVEADALKIWGFAEPGFKETRSSQLLQDTLKKAGFTIRANVAGMPTAFVASYRTGPGPVIAILAEMDALPGISQTAAAIAPTARAGMIAAHACGHNLLGAGAVGGAIAAARWMKQAGVSGEIRVYGSPAEEGGDGKAYLVRDGLFSDVDIVLHWHPGDRNAVMASRSQANIKTDFHFHGIASHAAASPDRGRSALAGLEVMDTAVNFMRQFTPDGTRIHGIVVDGGGAPNVVPAAATSSYYVRHVDVRIVQDLQARMLKAAQGAAMATETTVDWTIQGGVYALLVNDTLLQPMHAKLAGEVATLSLDPQETAFAVDVQKALKVPVDSSRVNQAEPVSPSFMGGSTDVGDVSYVVPTVGFSVAAWPLGTPAHSWASASASGSTMGTKAAVAAARVLAGMAVDLMGNPQLIAKAKAELSQKQGPGFHYQALFGDRAPPLNYTDKVMAKN